jgi:NADH-quinone oxidoreductase subunit M
MTAREVALFVPLIAWSIWIGIYPKPYFDILRQPVAEIVERVRPGYFGGAVQNAALPAPKPLQAQRAPRRGSDQSRALGAPRQPAGSSIVSERPHAGGGQ